MTFSETIQAPHKKAPRIQKEKINLSPDISIDNEDFDSNSDSDEDDSVKSIYNKKLGLSKE
jgi:hypothetical protein